jgi:DNA-dependent RNA polymerase auxiliary subunit epsilon
MASTSKEEFYTKEELGKIKYQKLVELDKSYSFRTSKKTKSTSMKADAIIKRLIKNGVPKFSSGTSLSSDVVEVNYSMKKTAEQELEDREYEIEYVKSIFQPKTLPDYQSQSNMFDFVLNGSYVRLSMSEPNFKMHVLNVYNPNYFIKDYKYLVKKWEINAKKLREKGKRHIQPKNSALGNFFRLQVIPTYSRIIVIENILQKIEAYRKSHPNVPKYPQEVASRLLEASYERYYTPPNNPINVLKFYIKELNKKLFEIRDKRGCKIMLNNSVIKELNKRLDKLNTYLVEPDPSIVGQANAKFYIRILENSSKNLTKIRNNSPHNKPKKTTQKRVKSF